MIDYQNAAGLRTIVCGIQHPDMTVRETEELTEELAGLSTTMGLEVVDRRIVQLRETNPRYLIGTGKAEEIAARAREQDVECIVFDDDLSPSQQRNWEKLTEVAVIDRHEAILEIFASRASTREAGLQVALARLEYSLPRLTRAWTHLSRQRGGAFGTRGSGETQLETDRRVILRKISQIKRELTEVRKQRTIRRKQREKEPVPAVSIVGYTNAGKSSLLNVLSGSEAYVADKLFATLDPLTRRVELPGGKNIVATDTVGFIRKLPHDLIESFKSTLEETTLADFLIHVLDSSSPDIDEQYATTLRVLDEIGAGDTPIITVLNKVDKLNEPDDRQAVMMMYPEAVPISTITGEGIESLLKAVEEKAHENTAYHDYILPADRYDLVALIHRKGKVIREEYRDGGIVLSARVAPSLSRILAEFAV